MDDRRDTDDALVTATERARQAEQRLVETSVEDPDIVHQAHKAYQRAEDVDELAQDATGEADG